MALERTLSIVKPDGVARNLIGQVIGRFEKVGLKVVAARMVHLSQRDAEGFYAVHAARPFFKDLVKYMTSGPVLVQVLEGESAIAKNREVMGATDPKKADPGTCGCGVPEGSCDGSTTAQCVQVNEGATAQLACAGGRTISSISFASYGNPTGTCGAYALGTCNATSSRSTTGSKTTVS